MASENKIIAFPNKINRSRLVGPLELDTLVVTFGTLLISYFLIGFLLVNSTIMKYGTIGGITVLTVFLYIFYKKNAKRGFLLHWLYVRSIYLPKYKGFEGLPNNFLPKGYEYEFRD